ncbi:hypothetical protein CLV42_1223 [Chitinophaga ginsengisoli]|uniref:Uncharacterized protein n=1 Tax=Chitinophaga ginsengisoli TaxID=363837 RepID=A0A2P8FKW5_9BACT|nr:hypothetical protein CLV42_1223 [Chitinophaga ginsengisoli]
MRLSISTSLDADVLLYDRAGYGKSGFNTEPGNISNSTRDLETVVDKNPDILFNLRSRRKLKAFSI